MTNRILGCLTGLLAAAWFAHAEAPGPALPVATGEPALVVETLDPAAAEADTQPDSSAPWPESPIPAYSTGLPNSAAANSENTIGLAEVVPAAAAAAAEIPGHLPPLTEPVQSEGSLLTLPAAPATFAPPPARPRWFSRAPFGQRFTAMPDALPPVETGSPGEVLLQPMPAPSSPAPPTEPLKLPAAGEPATDIAEAGGEAEPCPGRFWTTGEFLLWMAPRGRLLIPLVTSGPAEPFPPPGVLDEASTEILFNNDQLKYGNYPGARVTAGFWFTRNRILGVEANAFYVDSSPFEQEFVPGIASSGVISRPFFDARTGLTAVAVIAFPDVFTGTLDLDSKSEIYGGEVNLIGKLIRHEKHEVDILLGYRYFELSEFVEFDQNAVTLEDGVLAFDNVLLPAQTRVQFFDRFTTKNQFHGGQFGVRTIHHLGAMTVSLSTKVAIGTNRRIVNNDGFTTRVLPDGTSATLPGGIFVVPPANLGRFEDSVITAVPQLQFIIAYQCKTWLRAFAGYEITVLPRALRASEQINPVLNPELIPTFLGYDPTSTPIQPSVPFTARTFWAQGITIGFEVKY